LAALELPPNFGRKRLHVVRSSGPWQRLHCEKYSTLHFGKGRENRFDDPRSEYGVLYVAEDEFGAFVETFLRDPKLTLVARDELVQRRLSQIEASAGLSLVDLTGKGLQRIGVTGEVSTAPHALASDPRTPVETGRNSLPAETRPREDRHRDLRPCRSRQAMGYE
jgi:hypothetical protein